VERKELTKALEEQDWFTVRVGGCTNWSYVRCVFWAVTGDKGRAMRASFVLGHHRRLDARFIMEHSQPRAIAITLPTNQTGAVQLMKLHDVDSDLW